MTEQEALRRLMMLESMGLRSEGIGPAIEWSPLPPGAMQRRHSGFWGMIDAMYHDEHGTLEDIPEWMSEDATERLLNNSI